MLTNDAFKLSDDQLHRYDQWTTNIATDLGDADCGEALEVVVSFSFSALGRSVVVTVPTSGQTLVLEDNLN